MTKIRGQQIQLDSAKGIDVEAGGTLFIRTDGVSMGFDGSGNLVVIPAVSGGLALSSSPLDSGYANGGLYVRGVSSPNASSNGTPGTIANGDLWYNAVSDNYAGKIHGQVVDFSSCLYANTVESSAIASTASLTDFDQNLSSLAANFLNVGRTLRVTAGGRYSTTGTPTLNILLRYGTTTILQTSAITTTLNSSNVAWWFTGTVVCRGVGSSGAQAGNGLASLGGLLGVDTLRSGVPTVDTTSSLKLTMSAQWSASSSSNSVVLETFVIEVVR